MFHSEHRSNKTVLLLTERCLMPINFNKGILYLNKINKANNPTRFEYVIIWECLCPIWNYAPLAAMCSDTSPASHS